MVVVCTFVIQLQALKVLGYMSSDTVLFGGMETTHPIHMCHSVSTIAACWHGNKMQAITSLLVVTIV